MVNVICIAGESGTGKTFESLLFMENAQPRRKKIIIDLENKAKETYDYNVLSQDIAPGATIATITKWDASYKTDVTATYEEMKRVVNEIIETDAYDIIVLDSITVLRNETCADYYMKVKGLEAVGERNWLYVNDMVAGFVRRLATYCRAKNKILIIIAHMKDLYKDKEVIGRGPAIHDDLWHLADVSLFLEETEENTYQARISRSAAGKWTVDLSDKISLSDKLTERGLIL